MKRMSEQPNTYREPLGHKIWNGIFWAPKEKNDQENTWNNRQKSPEKTTERRSWFGRSKDTPSVSVPPMPRSGDIRDIPFQKRADIFRDVLGRTEKFRWSIDQNRTLKNYVETRDISKNSRDRRNVLTQSIAPSVNTVRARVRQEFSRTLWAELVPSNQENLIPVQKNAEDRISIWLQSSEILDHSERRRLAQYVESVSCPKTGASSCGAAVGTLLNDFWYRKCLPQSNRDGKKWDEFLSERPRYFKKVPCSHPSAALPGAILVYNGGEDVAGSAANKRFGHVEIKSASDRYVHYTKSNQPGWSARWQSNMGFCGYAFYPINRPA